MSQKFTDQFSILHFATGVIAYFWGVPLVWWFVLHALFELFEDTPTGVYLVNKLFGNIWPGGKKVPDSFTNSELGDNFYAMLGWLVSSWLDKQKSQNLKNKNVFHTRNGLD